MGLLEDIARERLALGPGGRGDAEFTGLIEDPATGELIESPVYVVERRSTADDFINAGLLPYARPQPRGIPWLGGVLLLAGLWWLLHERDTEEER